VKFIADTHMHTIVSGHAYSSIQEMARAAGEKGVQLIALTEHGPALPGACDPIYFLNLHAVPDEIYGVKILKGVEANIIDYEGRIDMPEGHLKQLDFVLAGFHDLCIRPSSVEDHTRAAVHVLMNPLIDTISHPGNPKFQVDLNEIVKTAKQYNKPIEINNHSFEVRAGSEKNCKELAVRCKEAGVRIVCGSDAHISFEIGEFGHVRRILKEVDFPEELILNRSVERLEKYLQEKKMFSSCSKAHTDDVPDVIPGEAVAGNRRKRERCL
jgi:putative hydrolase